MFKFVHQNLLATYHEIDLFRDIFYILGQFRKLVPRDNAPCQGDQRHEKGQG